MLITTGWITDDNCHLRLVCLISINYISHATHATHEKYQQYLGCLKKENTPEMNELERDKKILKIWAYNFEKQKS